MAASAHTYSLTGCYTRPQITPLQFKFRDDLTSHPPDHFVCVPLVLETLYNKVGLCRDVCLCLCLCLRVALRA